VIQNLKDTDTIVLNVTGSAITGTNFTLQNAAHSNYYANILWNFATANTPAATASVTAPVGTGPYLFVDFKPGDLVQGKINPSYHMENRPYFDTIEMKGGGDAVSAARAVLQTGEYDFAWNMQVEDEILKRLEARGLVARYGRYKPAGRTADPAADRRGAGAASVPDAARPCGAGRSFHDR